MPSLSEQILTQIQSVLTANGGIGCPVYRSRLEAATDREDSFAVVAPGPDRPVAVDVTSRQCFDKLDQRFMVAIAVYTRRSISGNSSLSFDQVADPIKVAIHQKLMSDRSLNGLAFDIIPAGWAPDLEASTGDAGMIICEYAIRYRTSAADISVA